MKDCSKSKAKLINELKFREFFNIPDEIKVVRESFYPKGYNGLEMCYRYKGHRFMTLNYLKQSYRCFDCKKLGIHIPFDNEQLEFFYKHRTLKGYKKGEINQ